MDGAKQKRVLLTRESNETLAEALRANGVEVLELPLIRTVHEAQNEDVEDIMREMGSYDWITFSSANGVKGFFREFFKNFDDIRTLGVARIACVGEATAAEVRKLHLRPDVVPAVSTALAMADAMAEYETLDNLKVLCVQGNLSLPDLPKTLDEKHRAIVDTAVVYKTEQVEVGADDKTAANFRKSGADAVVFASPSAVESFVKNAKNLLLDDGAVRPKIFSVGPTTTAALKKYAMNPYMEGGDVAGLLLAYLGIKGRFFKKSSARYGKISCGVRFGLRGGRAWRVRQVGCRGYAGAGICIGYFFMQCAGEFFIRPVR